MRSQVLLLVSLVFAVPTARAIIVAGGTGVEQTTNPGSGLPWDYVGTVGGASGVFLGAYNGDYWVLTASHVVNSGASLANFSVGGSTYLFVPGSGVVVRNGDNSPTDLTLFRISGGPALSNLTLASSAPAFGLSVALVGYGVRESGSQLYWNVTGSGAGTTWTSVNFADPWNYSGYATGGGGTERWGWANTINPSLSGQPSTYNVNTGVTQSVVTQFVDLSGLSQAGGSDSGGAMFYYRTGSGWELAGILGAVGVYTNQPGGTAVFGQTTYAGSIAFYNSAILADISAISAIPEPAGIALWCGALAGGVAFWTRRRRASAA